jgi:UTP--glucose-1-phosphate uridylyltransferase
MKVRKAVIPAAGVGTRFLPATKAVPKELIPIVDRPLIQLVVTEAVASGISDLVLITAAGKSSIENYFDIDPNLERFLEAKGKDEVLQEVRAVSRMVDVASIRQKEPQGLGHAVLCARDFIGPEPFAVMLPDELFDAQIPCLAQLLDIFEKTGRSVIALQDVPEGETHRYGIIDGDQTEPGIYRIRNLVEKPPTGSAPTNVAVVGRYVLVPGIFSCLESLPSGTGGEIQLTDALNRLAQADELYGLVIDGIRHDAGNKLGYLMATVHYALKDKDHGPLFLRYLREKLNTPVKR